MKKFKFLAAFVAFATLLGLTSCSDDQAELLNGGQGPAGSTILNINYTIPGDTTKVFHSTFVSAAASGDNVTITADNEDTGESLVIQFGNQLNKNGAFDNAIVTYIDPSGNEYSALSPFTNLHTGAVKLSESNAGSITGAFSFIGYDDDAAAPADGVPFFSGIFENVPLTGTLPTPLPYEPPFVGEMKAKVNGTDVTFGAAWTIVDGAETTIKGNNVDPAYSIAITFADNSTIAEGTFDIDETAVSAIVTIGEDSYEGVGGSVIITDITDNIVTGTFTISAENESGIIEVTAGSFKVALEE
ncbi:DUF6252 family protein [Flavobacterium hauense]